MLKFTDETQVHFELREWGVDVSKKLLASYKRVGNDTASMIYLVTMGRHRSKDVLVLFRDGPVYPLSPDVMFSITCSELLHCKMRCMRCTMLDWYGHTFLDTNCIEFVPLPLLEDSCPQKQIQACEKHQFSNKGVKMWANAACIARERSSHRCIHGRPRWI